MYKFIDFHNLLQIKLNSRFFIPKICLPKPYQYIKNYYFDEETMDIEDCVICMTPLHNDPITFNSKLIEKSINDSDENH